MFLLGKRRRGHGLGLVGGLGARRHPVDPRNAQAVCLGSSDWFLFGIQNAHTEAFNKKSVKKLALY